MLHGKLSLGTNDPQRWDLGIMFAGSKEKCPWSLHLLIVVSRRCEHYSIPGLTKFCEWVNSKKKRKIKIKVDGHDIWSADHTLALIIAPVLRKLKEQKRGSPLVDDEDVPENLRTTAAEPLSEEEKNTGHTDELWEQRWEWVLDEMIWTFEQHAADDWETQYYSGDTDLHIEKNERTGYGELVTGPNHTFKIDIEGRNAAYKRIENGRRLFAKYYRSLWV